MKHAQTYRESAIIGLEKLLYEKLAELEKQLENVRTICCH